MKQEILDFVNDYPCDDKGCSYMPLGVKPCGGPLEYLLHPVSMDTTKLRSMINNYNAESDQHNKDNNLMSDCSFQLPPSSIDCNESKRCTSSMDKN